MEFDEVALENGGLDAVKASGPPAITVSRCSPVSRASISALHSSANDPLVPGAALR